MPKGVGYSKAAMSRVLERADPSPTLVPGLSSSPTLVPTARTAGPTLVPEARMPGPTLVPEARMPGPTLVPEARRASPTLVPPPSSSPTLVPTPPPLPMPEPSIGKPGPLPPPPASFPSFGSSGSITGASSIGGAIFNVAAGGFVGGTTSYATGGSFTQGAIAGAAVGAGFGAAAKYQLPSRANAFVAKQLGQKGVTGYSKDIAGFTAGFENAAVRRGAFGAGAALGGFAFGGNRSHKRGFNGRRGNSIGR